ncbi:MAG: flagellar assembly factor FliW [Armatimonadota bacterium]|nr:MAG: flagellar assembly factor FliW [Armatimonadota bacterium]
MNVVTRFGEIEIEEKSCIHLKDGLVGIPQAKRFCLLSHREDSPFLWLQCLDEPALSLAVINPMDFFNDYEFDLQDADVEALELTSAEDAVVLTTVTVDEERRVTTNLLGPIVVNRRTLAAKQVVLSSENYSPRHLLFQLKRQPEDAAKEAGSRAA